MSSFISDEKSVFLSPSLGVVKHINMELIVVTPAARTHVWAFDGDHEDIKEPI